MADEELEKAVKLTQSLLGKHIKKPPLSDKNLSRPPFRFLHDITTSVISTTDFLHGVFTPEELDTNNVTTKESKAEFVKKLIAGINGATGENVPVRVSKILSGQEPVNTNLLLQALARGIEKTAPAPKTLKTAAAAKGSKAAPPNADGKPKGTTTTAGKSELKSNLSKSESKALASKKAPQSKPSTQTKPADPKSSKTDANKVKSLGTLEKPTNSIEKPSLARKKSVGDISGGRRGSNEKISTQTEGGQKPLLARQSSTLSKVERAGDSNQKGVNEESKGEGEDNSRTEHGMHDDNRVISAATSIKPNVGVLPVPTTSILSDTSAVEYALSEANNTNEENDFDEGSIPTETKKRGTAKTAETLNDDIVERAQDRGLGTFDDRSFDGEMTSRARPGTGTVGSRLGTARPPSARPAPPRPKSSVFKDSEEPNYRPPTGKVTHVLLDNADDGGDEDENFVVREAAVAQSKVLDDLDEVPEFALNLGGSKFDVSEELEDLLPEQRGLLLNQILETQKELEGRDVDKQDGSRFSTGTPKETSKAEIEKLKNLLQECARNANPLGKLLDYVREDIDAMQKEVSKWREESRLLDDELEAAKQSTEATIQPLQQEFAKVEAEIADKDDAIAATKMSILRLQERIEKILSGLDRVQSSHGKMSIPSASDLIKSNPIKPYDNSSFSQIDASNSSGFGNALNRLAKTTPGMRPISMFNAEDLEDPDNFDPFK